MSLPSRSRTASAPFSPTDRGYHGARLPRSPAIDPKTFAATLARWCQEKKAADIAVYRVADRLGVADYFVLATGLNRNHVRALENELHVRAKALGERHLPLEGQELHWWVVMDFSDVVVHLLQPEARDYYDLDRLYRECPRLEWETLPVADDLHAAEA